MTTSRRVRPAGRVIVLDPSHACLLAHVSSADGTWLFTPGGGVDGDEDALAAARREVSEETSLHLGRLAGPVLYRRAHFTFLGDEIEARETFWVARVDVRTPIAASNLDDYELDLLGDWRWLTADELQAAVIPVYPRCLPDLMRALANPKDVHNPLVLGAPWVEEEILHDVQVAVAVGIPDWADS